MLFNEPENKFLAARSLSMPFDRRNSNLAEDAVDMDTHNHHTLNVVTALDATSPADLTALRGIRSAQSATRLTIGSLNAEEEDHHPRQTIHREVSMEPDVGPPEDNLDTAKGLMLLMWELTTLLRMRSQCTG